MSRLCAILYFPVVVSSEHDRPMMLIARRELSVNSLVRSKDNRVMSALISKGPQAKRRHVAVLLGVGLTDAREEMFVVMVCDGLPLRLAYARAGFESTDNNAPYKLFHLPRLQERAAAILEARRTTGVLSLAEVTDMLKRVYAGAQSAEEYSAAHNAAFSLARLYGHVTDRQTVEVIRRPSRDPDAPSEQALSSWVQDLPSIEGSIGPFPGPPASLLGLSRDDPVTVSDNLAARAASGASHTLPNEIASEVKANDINSLASNTPCVSSTGSLDWTAGGDVPGRPENGAPAMAVTVTPTRRARSGALDVSRETNEGTRSQGADEGTAPHRKIVPSEARLERAEPAKVPSFKDLFGE
jgi:hypothetical protein